MPRTTSLRMRQAQHFIRQGNSAYAAAKLAKIEVASIYQSQFWKERKSQSWWKTHPSNKERGGK